MEPLKTSQYLVEIHVRSGRANAQLIEPRQRSLNVSDFGSSPSTVPERSLGPVKQTYSPPDTRTAVCAIASMGSSSSSGT